MTTPPDILFVVLDCVRAGDLPGGDSPVGGLDTLENLARDGLLFSHAVAPASWTVPSHASMFTDQYPWKHGAFGSRPLLVAEGPRTIAERLEEAEYQSGSFSANPYISNKTGLTRGFYPAFWGNWFDCGLRKISKWLSHPESSDLKTDSAPLTSKLPDVVRSSVRALVDNFPLLTDPSERLVSRILSGFKHTESRVSPWIEHSVTRWLATIPERTPAFCFVNLLDAHEPYLGLPERIINLSDWLESLYGWQRGDRTVAEGNGSIDSLLKGLRSAYQAALPILDRRLSALLNAFRGMRDWDNTCVILTSDHGQAFGEDGNLFHGLGASSSVHRVPLIVKLNGATEGGKVHHEWFSTRHIAGLITSMAGVRPLGEEMPELLRTQGSKEVSPEPVLSLVDGDRMPELEGHKPRNRPASGGSSVIGYEGSYRVTVDLGTMDVKILDLGLNNVSGSGYERSSDSVAAHLKSVVTRAAREVNDLAQASLPSRTVARRLNSWGYEDWT